MRILNRLFGHKPETQPSHTKWLDSGLVGQEEFHDWLDGIQRGGSVT